MGERGLGLAAPTTRSFSKRKNPQVKPSWETFGLQPHHRHRPTTMASRPTVSIATAEGKASGATQALPSVFSAPIRSDIVQYANPHI